LLARFAEDVLAKRWQGDKKVWIVPDEPGGEMIPFPDGYDHLRAMGRSTPADAFRRSSRRAWRRC
jgi:hypothetical protein